MYMYQDQRKGLQVNSALTCPIPIGSGPPSGPGPPVGTAIIGPGGPG